LPLRDADRLEEILNRTGLPDALTIGFARPFARYKRTGRPVQIIYAGKAHPRDDAGKALIQQVVKLAQRKNLRRRLVFLEDSDMAVSRYLVQGSDIWLNTPVRPLEASGTSGKKAMANGAQLQHAGWMVGRSPGRGVRGECVHRVGHRAGRAL